MPFFPDPIVFAGKADMDAYVNNAVSIAQGQKNADPNGFRDKFNEYLNHILEADISETDARQSASSLTPTFQATVDAPDKNAAPTALTVRGQTANSNLTAEEENLVRLSAILSFNVIIMARRNINNVAKRTNEQKTVEKKEATTEEEKYQMMQEEKAIHEARERESAGRRNRSKEG